MNFLAKRRKEKEEKRKEEEIQRRAQRLEKLITETAENLHNLRSIKDLPPRESRVSGSHEFQFNNTTYRNQRSYITRKIVEAKADSGFDFILKDIGVSREELDDIRLAAIRADVMVDGPEFGLIVTERPNSMSFAGSVVGSVDDLE